MINILNMSRFILKKNDGKIILNNIATTNKPIVKVKKKRKKKKKKKQGDNLYKQYLDYDLDIDLEFKKALSSNISATLNMNLIDKLPKLKSDDIIVNNIPPPTNKIKIKLKTTKPRSTSIDIDVDSLDKNLIGNKQYYMDYDKGIIYDSDLNCVGNIGEFGEIII